MNHLRAQWRQAALLHEAMDFDADTQRRLEQIRDDAFAYAGGPGGCQFAAEAVEREFGWTMVGGHYLGGTIPRDTDLAMLEEMDWSRVPTHLLHLEDDHYWNVLPDGSYLDVTSAQFNEGHDIRTIRRGHPDYDRYWIYPLWRPR